MTEELTDLLGMDKITKLGNASVVAIGSKIRELAQKLGGTPAART